MRAPLDTVPGIIDAINTIRPAAQCRSTFTSSCTTVFCCKREGHEGDCRGTGKQWNATGRVKITEKCP